MMETSRITKPTEMIEIFDKMQTHKTKNETRKVAKNDLFFI